jgi:hypothetical protein
MTRTPRWERNAFLLFLGACFVALMAALPVVTAQTQPKKEESQPQPSAAAGATVQHPSFEQLDRNKDGVVDKSEAGGVPGLSALFERADQSGDGKLDPDEYRKGLEILQVRR